MSTPHSVPTKGHSRKYPRQFRTGLLLDGERSTPEMVASQVKDFTEVITSAAAALHSAGRFTGGGMQVFTGLSAALDGAK